MNLNQRRCRKGRCQHGRDGWDKGMFCWLYQRNDNTTPITEFQHWWEFYRGLAALMGPSS